MVESPQHTFQTGDLDAARRQLNSMPSPSPRDLELRATIDYLQGRYPDAVDGFRRLAAESALNPQRRRRSKLHLSLAYFQMNQFEAAARLALRDPMTRLMRAFSGTPNVVTWAGHRRAVLGFLQKESWELPQVGLCANGENMVAKIDTGGDLFSLPWPVAKRIGVDPVVTSTGWFAGGRRAPTAHGILERLDLDGVTISNVPVSINSFDHAIVGTGLLRQFLSTLDYPRGELVLEPRRTRGDFSGFPFVMAGTHLLVANGEVNGLRVRLLVDSGLEVTNNGCFLAPEPTLAAAGIPVPEQVSVAGTSGAGPTQLEIGEFVVEELSLGSRTQRQSLGLTGIFPPQLSKTKTIGFPLDGLISHNFLRHYRWTLDFDRMIMSLE